MTAGIARLLEDRTTLERRVGKDAERLLGELYSAEGMRRLLQAAGIDTQYLDFSGSDVQVAYKVMGEVRKRRRVRDLLEQMDIEFGADRSDVREAYHAVQLLASTETTTAKQPSNRVFDRGLNHVVDRHPLTPAEAERVVQRPQSLTTRPEKGEDWVEEAGSRLRELEDGLDSLQVHLELLHVGHDTYSFAADLVRQSRRLEQITDLTDGEPIPRRLFRDTLNGVSDTQGRLDQVAHEALVGRVIPPLVIAEVCNRYTGNLTDIRNSIVVLRGLEDQPREANDAASHIAYTSKDLQVFWDGVIQQLYLRFNERLRKMRDLLQILT